MSMVLDMISYIDITCWPFGHNWCWYSSLLCWPLSSMWLRNNTEVNTFLYLLQSMPVDMSEYIETSKFRV